MSSHALPGCRVFPYSIFYVFFEQYEYIVKVAVVTTCTAGAVIFLLCIVRQCSD